MQVKVAVALVATLVAAASAFSTTPLLALRRSMPAASTRRPTVLALSMQEVTCTFVPSSLTSHKTHGLR